MIIQQTLDVIKADIKRGEVPPYETLISLVRGCTKYNELRGICLRLVENRAKDHVEYEKAIRDLIRVLL